MKKFTLVPKSSTSIIIAQLELPNCTWASNHSLTKLVNEWLRDQTQGKLALCKEQDITSNIWWHESRQKDNTSIIYVMKQETTPAHIEENEVTDDFK